ncbi:MAG: TetR/AcrR family transcriptional regulator [Sneathiella sp.]|nr:TetR/AcrR family transcriptional regulator [Sneathiella sp.]
MTNTTPDLLKPRKAPRQARSAATVDAIFDATIQVLLAEGSSRLTTTRVAERAGVSVGTMYQYFPHKKSLLYAMLQRQLAKLRDLIEAVCWRMEGRTLGEMSDGLVTAYLDAKTSNIEASRALYLVASGLDTDDLIADISQRVGTAITRLLASASDSAFGDIEAVSFTFRAALSGAVRTVLERGANPKELTVLRRDLPIMCRAYLSAVAEETPKGGGASKADALPHV